MVSIGKTSIVELRHEKATERKSEQKPKRHIRTEWLHVDVFGPERLRDCLKRSLAHLATGRATPTGSSLKATARWTLL
jgi:hypothetical protein